MNQSSTVSFDATALKSLGLGEDQASKLFAAALRREHLREQMGAADVAYRELLPYATPAQMELLVTHVANETSPDVGLRPNVDFRLDEAQEARLTLVRADRAAYCTKNKDTIMIPLQEDDEQKLVSYKVRVGAKKTTTSLRFEKTVVGAAAKKGLLASLAAAASTGAN